MYDKAVAEAVVNKSAQQNDVGVPLTAERLSTLRHDLRTPFNQIIGYAEMIGEDADEAGDSTVQEAAGATVASAHSALNMIAAALQREPEMVSPRALATMRAESAPALQTLFENAHALENAVQSSASLPEDTPQNVQNLCKALENLKRLHAATAQWHSDSSRETSSSLHDSSVQIEEQSQHIASPATMLQTFDDATKFVSESSKGAIVLIVDDHVENRDLLRQRLQREGMQTRVAAGGAEALAILNAEPIDLVLLDVLMPGMDGIEVLQRIKGSDSLHKTPVIMISALSEIEKVVQCIETGAEDYLSKPFNPVLLRARIGVTLERKRLRDDEEKQRAEMSRMLGELEEEREKARTLLLNILPEKVAKDLQQGHSAPMYFEDATIGFTDFVGFTLSTENMAAELVVEELHTYFTAFDRVMERYELEKMKTIGDSYMFASGLPNRHPGNPINGVLAALELAEETRRLSERPGAPGWQLRIGLHTGPLIAGVVGIRKFAFDIWGDSVNFASRMESSGAPGRINVSERTYARIKDFLQCEPRGKVMTKDKREVDMYFVNGVQPALIADGTTAAFERRYKLYFGEMPPAFPQFLLDRARS